MKVLNIKVTKFKNQSNSLEEFPNWAFDGFDEFLYNIEDDICDLISNNGMIDSYIREILIQKSGINYRYDGVSYYISDNANIMNPLFEDEIIKILK